MKLLLVSVFMLMLMSLSAFAEAVEGACFAEASKRYLIPESVLRSISFVESGGKPIALNRNTNGSFDIGHMQINSSWIPVLARFGITPEQLYDACTNTLVGAWILARNIQRHGYTWQAIGAYNAHSPIKQAVYQRKVAKALYGRKGLIN